MPNNYEGLNDHSMNTQTKDDTNAPDPTTNAPSSNSLFSVIDPEVVPEGSLYSEICDVYNELSMPIRAFYRPLFRMSRNLAESDTPEPCLDAGQTV